MATSRRLNLTRDQLAAFLGDQQQIRQFELLFSVADEVQYIPTELAEVSAAAGSAQASANAAIDAIFQLAQESFVSSASAESKANQALELLSRLTAAVEGLQMAPPPKEILTADVESLQIAPPPKEFKRSRYGSFYDTTTQTATTINTAKAITFNNTDLSGGVYLGSPTSRIYVDTEGIYNFDTSFQLDKTAGGVGLFYLWFRLNGVDVPDSASQIRIQGNNAEIFASLNYFFDLKANDYVEIMYSVDDLTVQLLAEPASAPHPGIPSIILTVSNNIGGIQ